MMQESRILYTHEIKIPLSVDAVVDVRFELKPDPAGGLYGDSTVRMVMPVSEYSAC